MHAGNIKVCLTHNNADEVLERYATANVKLEPTDYQPWDFTANARQALSVIDQLYGAPLEQLNVLVGSNADRRESKSIMCHCVTSALPSGSVLHVDEGLYVAAPALNLVLQADSMHAVELCKVLGRYWGTFSTVHSPGDRSKIVERPALTNPFDLALYLNGAPRRPGLGTLRDAMRFTCENARSPQEVNLQLILNLPPVCNGFCLQKPIMNYKIRLNEAEKKLYDADYIKIDLYWPEARFGLEYLGEEEHKDRMIADISRWYAAKMHGIELMFVTKAQLQSPEAIDFIAREVAKRTRKRIVASTWPTFDEIELLIDVLFDKKSLNPDKRLRVRPIRNNKPHVNSPIVC